MRDRKLIVKKKYPKNGKEYFMGYFYDFVGKDGKYLRRKLCDYDEAAFKVIKGRKIKRRHDEMRTYTMNLYELKRRELEEKDSNKKIEGKNIRISVAFDLWLKYNEKILHHKTMNHKKNTKKHYLICVGDHLISDLHKDSGVKLIDYLRERNLSENTINKYISHLQNFLNFLYDEEKIKYPIKLKKNKQEIKEPGVYSIDDLNNLISLAEDQRDPRYALGRKNIHRCLIMMKYTSFRRGEVWALALENIKLDQRVIQIRFKKEINWKPKWLKERDIKISQSLFEYLEKDFKDRKPNEKWYLDSGNGNLHFSDISSITAIVKKYCEKLGITDVKPIHGIRATIISYLLNEKKLPIQDVQLMAGHSNISMTRKYWNTAQANMSSTVDNIDF